MSSMTSLGRDRDRDPMPFPCLHTVKGESFSFGGRKHSTNPRGESVYSRLQLVAGHPHGSFTFRYIRAPLLLRSLRLNIQ